MNKEIYDKKEAIMGIMESWKEIPSANLSFKTSLNLPKVGIYGMDDVGEEREVVEVDYEKEVVYFETEEEFIERFKEENNGEEPGLLDSREEYSFGDVYFEGLHSSPMWGTAWYVDSKTAQWIKDNLPKSMEIGLKVFEDDEGEIIVGIDGAGYDFYEAHWIPLYEAMAEN